MAALVGIDSRCVLRIEVRHRNQPYKNKLALYKPLLHFYSHLKQPYEITRRSTSVIKVYEACVDVHISRRLKEELAWATDKQL